jgi:hypothetical protein
MKERVRPKGSPYPFQPIHAEDEGMIAIQWHFKNGVSHTAWYDKDELEAEK